MTTSVECDMLPGQPGRPQGGGTNQPVGLPDLRPSGPYQPVILVADDEPLIRNLLARLMHKDGYFVLSAADGQEGLELSRKYPGTIDMVITDVNMPRMSGTDLCGHLMEERPGIKILIMSGAGMSKIVSQNPNLPFLPKPFDGKTIRARVRAILAAQVQRPELLFPTDIAP
jgi:DNA-binding response OmpR family regulator